MIITGPLKAGARPALFIGRIQYKLLQIILKSAARQTNYNKDPQSLE